jgi:hypothetical protein
MLLNLSGEETQVCGIKNVLFHQKKTQQKVIKKGSEISAETLMISRKQLINLPELIHQRAGMV